MGFTRIGWCRSGVMLRGWRGKMGELARKQDESVWLTTKEAAVYVKMHKRTLLEHIAKGTLKPDSRARPGFKVHRFRRETLDKWLKGD